MLIFRICRDIYQTLDGEGARLFGGRWNSPGRPVVYASENVSLCILEQLVHLEPELIPNNWVVITIQISEHCSSERLVKLPTNEEASRKFGDKWLLQKRSLYLRVPSFVVAKEHNILLNPLHPEMSKVVVKDVSPFVFDPRFLKKVE